MTTEVQEQVTYVKPVLEKINKMTFPIDLIRRGDKTIICKQCSSCHGCR